MTIASLSRTIEMVQAKLADPRDGDDKRWLARWLKCCEQQLVKKTRNFEHKQEFARNRRREPPARTAGDA